MLVSVVVAVFMGTEESLLAGTLSGAQDAVELCMRLVGTMAL
jgi:spore maturation protein SpmA